MKKIAITCLLVLVCAFGVQAKEHSFDIGYEFSNYKYEEPGMMNLRSQYKQGVSASYMYLAADTGFLLGVDAKYLQGDVDYSGSTWGGDPLKMDNLKDYYIEAAVKLGRQYPLSDQLSLAGYTGIGWRRLRNHLEEGGPGGYLRQSTYVYLPMGAYLTYEAPHAWRLRLNGEIDCLLKGQQISDLDFERVTNDQTSGWGARISVKAEKDFGNIGLFIEPFFRYWEIAESDSVSVFIPGEGYGNVAEPKNKTREYGLRAGFSF